MAKEDINSYPNKGKIEAMLSETVEKYNNLRWGMGVASLIKEVRGDLPE